MRVRFVMKGVEGLISDSGVKVRRRSAECAAYLVGTRAFSSSNQFKTTSMRGAASREEVCSDSTVPVIAPSGPKSNRLGSWDSTPRRSGAFRREPQQGCRT